MEWLNFILNQLNIMDIPFRMYEDFSIEILGPIPHWLQLFVDMWHLISDNFHS